MKSLDLRLTARVLAVGAALAIAVLSLSPSGDTTMEFLHLFEGLAEFFFDDGSQVDKIGHFLAYAALGGLSAFGVRMVGDARRVLALLALALGFYGGLLEVLQGLFPDRVSSLADWMANMLGVFAGFVLAELAHTFSRTYQ
ncbi:MAG: VanZ family protein [Pseudomonadota bacterium]